MPERGISCVRTLAHPRTQRFGWPFESARMCLAATERLLREERLEAKTI